MVISRPRYPTAAARVANSVTPLRRDAGHTACRNDNHSYLGCTYEIFHALQTASHPGRCERRQRANVAQSCNTPNVVERGCSVASHPGRCERRQRANVAQSCNTPNVVERGCREVKQKQTRIGGAASPSLFCLSDLDCQLALQQVSKEYHPRVGVSFPAGRAYLLASTSFAICLISLSRLRSTVPSATSSKSVLSAIVFVFVCNLLRVAK